MEKKLETLQRDHEKLAKTHSQTSASLVSKEDDVLTLASELKSAKDSMDSLEKELRLSKSAYHELESKHNQRGHDFGRLQEQLASTQATAAHQEQQIAELLSFSEEATSQIEQLSAAATKSAQYQEALKGELKQVIDEKQSALTERRETSDQLAATRAELEQEMYKHSEEEAKWSMRNEGLVADMEDMRRALSQLKQEFQAQEEKLRARDHSLHEANLKVDSFGAQVTKLQGALQQSTDRESALTEQAARAAEMKAAQHTKLTEMSTEQTTLIRDLQASARKVDSLEAQQAELYAEKNRLSSELAELRASNTVFERDTRSTCERIQTLEMERSRSTKLADELQQKLATMQCDLQECKFNLRTAEADKALAQKQLEDVTAALNTAKAELQDSLKQKQALDLEKQLKDQQLKHTEASLVASKEVSTTKVGDLQASVEKYKAMVEQSSKEIEVAQSKLCSAVEQQRHAVELHVQEQQRTALLKDANSALKEQVERSVVEIEQLHAKVDELCTALRTQEQEKLEFEKAVEEALTFAESSKAASEASMQELLVARASESAVKATMQELQQKLVEYDAMKRKLQADGEKEDGPADPAQAKALEELREQVESMEAEQKLVYRKASIAKRERDQLRKENSMLSQKLQEAGAELESLKSSLGSATPVTRTAKTEISKLVRSTPNPTTCGEDTRACESFTLSMQRLLFGLQHLRIEALEDENQQLQTRLANSQGEGESPQTTLAARYVFLS
jgi:chromosome segregation ATPase